MKTRIVLAAMLLTARTIVLGQRAASRLKLLTSPLPLLLIVCALVQSTRAEYLFVDTQESDAVAVIDSSSDRIIAKIPTGAWPVRITMSPDRHKAYVSNRTDNTVSVIDTVALTTTATIPVGASPQESEVTPDGRRLFLVHNKTDFVTVIDTATNRVINEVFIGGHLAKDVLFTLNGRFAYVANFDAGTVNIINTATYGVETITTAPGPRRLAISPAGDRVFVTNYNGNSMSVIGTRKRKLIATIPVGGHPRGIATKQ